MNQASLALLLLLPLLAGACKEGPKGSSPRPGGPAPAKKGPKDVVLRYGEVEVTRDLVEPYVDFLLSRKPSLAPDSARRFLVLRYALPMAWALKKEPQGFRRSRALAEKWLARIRKGETTLEAVLKEELRKFGEDPRLARPVTTLWTALPVPLARAVFQAPLGKPSGPVRTPQGWCLFQVAKIQPGLTRDQDLVTLLQVVAPPDGKAFWKELQAFTRRLAAVRGEIEVVDPAYQDVVPLVMKKRKPSSRPGRDGRGGREK